MHSGIRFELELLIPKPAASPTKWILSGDRMLKIGRQWNAERIDEVRVALFAEYEKRFPRSRALASRGRNVCVNGLQQAGRNYPPFPLFIENATGPYVRTVDGQTLVDLWLGHFVSIDGHAPAYSSNALSNALTTNQCFQVGQPSLVEIELIEELTSELQFEFAQTTLSGAEATAAACRLARTRSGRRIIGKCAGGWHGVQPWSSIGTRAGLATTQEQLGAPRVCRE